MKKIDEMVVVGRTHGLHARPATIFVQLANKFSSQVRLEKSGEVVDGKSIIGILSLGVNKGVKVRLVVEGEDAQDAARDLKTFLESEHD